LQFLCPRHSAVPLVFGSVRIGQFVVGHSLDAHAFQSEEQKRNCKNAKKCKI
jgi:hypothetical protein